MRPFTYTGSPVTIATPGSALCLTTTGEQLAQDCPGSGRVRAGPDNLEGKRTIQCGVSPPKNWDSVGARSSPTATAQKEPRRRSLQREQRTFAPEAALAPGAGTFCRLVRSLNPSPWPSRPPPGSSAADLPGWRCCPQGSSLQAGGGQGVEGNPPQSACSAVPQLWGEELAERGPTE